MRFLKRPIVWIPIVVLLLITFVFSFFRTDDTTERLEFGEVAAAARSGELERVELKGTKLYVTLRDDPTEYNSRLGEGVDLIAALRAEGATIGGEDTYSVSVRFHGSSSAASMFELFLFYVVPFFVFGFLMYHAVLRALRKVRSEEDAHPSASV